MIIEMTRCKRSTRSTHSTRSTRSKRSTRSTRSKRSTRGGARARSKYTFKQKQQAHQTLKRRHADKGVFHTMKPRTTHRFASGRDARKFRRYKNKHVNYLDIGEAAASSMARASRKQKQIANNVSSGPMAGFKMSRENHEDLHRAAKEELDKEEMAVFTKAFENASLSASSVAGEPYRMNRSHTFSYLPSKQRKNQAAASAAEKLKSMRLGPANSQ